MPSSQGIDAHIVKLQDEIRRQKAMKNAQTLLGKLPAEVLVHVLHYADPLDILAMHSVCQQTQGNMEDASELWSDIPLSAFKDSRSVELSIQCSRNRPLAFRSPVDASDDTSYAIAFDHLARCTNAV
jgi:hypothetical protein